MATAPTPQTHDLTTRKSMKAAAQTVYVFRVDHPTVGEFRWPVNLATLEEQRIVHRQVGIPYPALLEPMQELSLAVFWWLARRRGGERSLSWAQIEQQWPAGLTLDEIEAFPEGEDPQAQAGADLGADGDELAGVTDPEA